MRALIVEQGNSRGALAAARALDSAGWFVGVGSPAMRGLATRSRSCKLRHHVPLAHLTIDGFVAAVARACRQGGYDVVFGAGEADVMALSLRRSEIPATVPYGHHGLVLAASDKANLERVARNVGFATAETFQPDELEPANEPYVVKARLHARPEDAGRPPRIDTNVVWGAAAVRQRIEELEQLGAEPQVQRFYEGPLLAYAAVVDRDHQIVADSMQLATRIWPPHAGASCRATTVDVDRRLSATAANLFRELRWFGLAELQFVVPSSGGPVLIDLNGRFYGSLSLAFAAGANLPSVWGDLALGRPVGPVRARPGVRYQWLEGDLRRALIERRHGLIVDVLDTVRHAGGAVHSIIDLRDLGPTKAHLAERLKRGSFS